MAGGTAALADRFRSGRHPPALERAVHVALLNDRIATGPDPERDGLVACRRRGVQTLIEQEPRVELALASTYPATASAQSIASGAALAPRRARSRVGSGSTVFCEHAWTRSAMR